ncbi:hypothetical protein [Acidovorax sp. BL-A-41-H1]|uniref:hypothetical protein n=1 Tax=Acidovorax sp. BL-A-41-H1 TaxID=3421102 RepID=UPI003F7995BA
MNDTKDLIREIQEHIGLNGIEDTATHLLVQAAAALQRQADELAAIGAGGVSGPLLGEAQAPAVPADGPPGSGGWRSHAEDMERERDYWRQRAKLMSEHQDGVCWYWQGDDSDYPESLVNSLPVVIRADQLRALVAQPRPASVMVDFAQVGTAGPLPVVNGRVSLPDTNMQDLVHMLRPTFEAQAQAAPAVELIQCRYGDNGYACCEGGPCQADLHNEAMLAAAPQPEAQAAMPASNPYQHSKSASAIWLSGFAAGQKASDEAMRKDAELLDFICDPSRQRMVEQSGGFWRVYQDEAPLEAEHHLWQSMTSRWYPTARDAIKAALAAQGDKP